MRTINKLWLGLGVLIVLSPLGLFLPDHFKAGDAWGEWGTDGIKELVGYVPRGLERLSSFWSAPMPDYMFKGWEDKGLGQLSLAYIVSAVVGIGIVIAVIYFLSKVLISKKD